MSRKKNSGAAAVLDAPPDAPLPLPANDFGRIKGQEAVKRAVTIALAGRHFIVLVGPSGNGKSLLIEAAKAIDPEFKAKEVTVWNKLYEQDEKRRAKHFEPMTRMLADIFVEVPSLPFREWASQRPGTDTASIRRQVEQARAFAAGHYDLNLSESCLLLAKQAYDELGMTPRALDAANRLARTIANMDQSEEIQDQHLAEAVQYRLFDCRY